jgi:hypothetical protein
MLGLVLLPILNIALFMGMFKDNENLLNIAIFIMWIMAILHFFAMFASEEDLLKNPYGRFFRVLMRTLVFITIIHSVYWGYIFVPTVWAIAAIVLWARRHQLENRHKKIY